MHAVEPRGEGTASARRDPKPLGLPGGRTKLVALPTMCPPEDCQRCGLCCFSPAPAYVPVTGADWSRLGPDADRWAHFIGNRAYMKMESGHCAALVRSRDAAGQAWFACSIYALRPQTCRDLERGSPQCDAECLRKNEARALDCSTPPAP